MPAHDPPDPPDSVESLSGRLLAGQGHRVRLLGRATVVLALENAVREVLAHRLGVEDPDLAEEAVIETREAFFRHLAGRGRPARSLTEAGLEEILAEARRRLERSRDEARERLAELERQLDEQRRRIAGEEESRRRDLDRALDPERSDLAAELRRRFRAAGLEEPRHQRLLAELTGLVFAELRAASQQVAELERARHEEELARAERRIARLAASLETAERNLRRLSEARSLDPGLASIYREVQGLADEDDLADLKREMLVKIFEANLRLRQRRRPDDE
ncbi:MAG: hypothetical protein D6702_08585 [Planctomycetota bacterium]|nr:MAG: hypothetical protein D6702_08585 [Planctomycetota bacterium]